MLFDREPVLIATLIRAGILLATAFGLNLDPPQIAALVLFSEAALSVAVRRVVVSPATAAGLAQGATTPMAGPPATA